MSKFNEINDKQNKITEQLNTKSNELKSILPEDYNWKKTNIIAETEWITGTTYPVGVVLQENQRLPGYVNLYTFLDFVLDKKFIPFLNVEVLTKNQEIAKLVGLVSFNYETLSPSYVEIWGNGGTLLYKGLPYPITHLYSQADLDADMFPINNTKPVYSAEIIYTDETDGFDYKITGTLSAFEGQKKVGLSPGGNQNLDIWITDYNPNYLSSKNYSKFSALSSSSYSSHGQKTEVRWTPSIPPYEFQINTNFDDVAISQSFSFYDLQSYFITTAQKFKKVGTDWVYQEAGDFYVVDSTNPFDGTIIISKTFTFVGYWVFYHSDTAYLIGVRDVFPITYENGTVKKELYNLPQDPFRYWSTITLKQNPTAPTVILTPGLESGYMQNALIKRFKTTDSNKDKYRIQIDGVLMFSLLADQAQPYFVPVYNDVYTKSGTEPGDTYSKSENHSFLPYNNYRAGFVDVEYKIRITLINPYEFSARNNYGI